jgi:hypothetical protein
MKARRALSLLLLFIGAYHVVIGICLMFSTTFQRFAVNVYGASFDFGVRDVYFIRIIGSFVLVLGSVALGASRNPVANWPAVLSFVEFFALRDVSRHLYSKELYEGFHVSPLINVLTSVVFGAQALLLVALLWQSRREVASDHDPTIVVAQDH